MAPHVVPADLSCLLAGEHRRADRSVGGAPLSLLSRHGRAGIRGCLRSVGPRVGGLCALLLDRKRQPQPLLEEVHRELHVRIGL